MLLADPADVEIELSLTRKQLEIYNDPARFKVFLAGRRYGKSVFLMYLFIKHALENPGTMSAYVTPVNKQCRSFFKKFIKMEGIEQLFAKKPTLFPTPEIEWIGGHRTIFGSFDNAKSLRGDGFSLLCTDESSDLVEDKIESVLMPMISKGRAKLYICGTICTENWLWQRFLQGQDKTQELWRSWACPTEEGIDFQGPIGKQSLMELKNSIRPEIWESEYNVKPKPDQLATFLHLGDSIVKAMPRPDPVRERGPYVLGVDMGNSRDFTAHALLGVAIDRDTGRKVATVVETEVFPHAKQWTTPILAERARARASFWNGAKVILDATGGASGGKFDPQQFVKEYQASIPDLKPFFWSGNRNNATKDDVIGALMIAMEKHLILIPEDHKELIIQLRNYKTFTNKWGAKSFGCIAPMHDDLVAALAQAWWGVLHNWFNDPVGHPVSSLY